ncbi:hypothetical protein [Amaricoccus macauensis]|uniref:hypothetical protein n=1 Tax=Amaricoccus macauensis TaxID=57001 RepID=UPI003C7CCF88
MQAAAEPELDLMPPAFSDGLHDWSRGDGRPDTPTYGDLKFLDARIVEDSEFGPCLEIRKTDTIQRLRYMGEMPFRPGCYLEVSARIKALSGPRGLVRIAAMPGGRHGKPVTGLDTSGNVVGLDVFERSYEAVAVFGPEMLEGVSVVWNDRVLYAHVGLDIIGPNGGIVRIENLRVRDVTNEITGAPRIMPGFTKADLSIAASRD